VTVKKDIIAILIGIVIFVSLFGSIYTVKLPAPDNAVVYIDQEKKIYYAPPLIDKLAKSPQPEQTIDVKKLKASTLKEVRALNYSPDEVSREKGYFVQQYRSFTSYLLEKMGLSKPLPSRWTKEGAWNW
jgi:hypothetical protein